MPCRECSSSLPACRVSIHISRYIYRYLYINIQVCIYIYIHTHIYTRSHTHAYIPHSIYLGGCYVENAFHRCQCIERHQPQRVREEELIRGLGVWRAERPETDTHTCEFGLWVRVRVNPKGEGKGEGVYICRYIHTYIHTCIYIHIYMHTFIDKYIDICVCIYTYERIRE